MAQPPEDADARGDVFRSLEAYAEKRLAPREFVPGKTPVPPSGKVVDASDLKALADASMDLWLTAGRFADRFEADFAGYLGLRHSLLTNSGSSANLLAVSALTSLKLGDKRLKAGDEVITTAASFPTTVNPIVQNGLTPVLVDTEIGTYNPSVDAVAAAITDKTRAVILAHTLGNPFDAASLAKLAEEKGLWLIEDCCDALGATLGGKKVSGFGDLSTFSFYPAHHITMGEGGAVATDNTRLKPLVESFRDWGRDCWCAPGCDDTCGKRFGWKLGDLPEGYDHKYTYSHVGYNLKVTDMQAAVGLSQLSRADGFIAARRANAAALLEGLSEFEEHLIFPREIEGAESSWFGLPLTLKDGAPFSREKLTGFLEASKIGTRLLFAGNIARQPYFKDIPHRRVGDLAVSDKVMRDTFWIGTFPGITEPMRAYVLERFRKFFKGL